MKQAMAVGGDVLIVAGAGAEEVAEFVVAPTEALGRGEALEAAHTSDAAFDAAMILFQAIVFVATGAMGDPPVLSGFAPTGLLGCRCTAGRLRNQRGWGPG